MAKFGVVAVIIVAASLLILRAGPAAIGTIGARFFATPTPTAVPTATPLPAVECDEAINLVFQRHPDVFTTMQSDMHLTLLCGDPQPNRNRSVFLNWSWAGQQHFAEYSITPTRELSPVDANAQRFDTYANYGKDISAVMRYFD